MSNSTIAIRLAAEGGEQVVDALRKIGQAGEAELGRAGRASGLTANQVQNLGRQVNDVGTMLASGSSPFQVMATQAGQVFDALSSGPGGLSGGVKGVGRELLGLLTPGKLAFGGLALAIGGVVVAQQRYAAGQQAVSASLAGMGRSTNSTVDGLNRVSEAAAGAAKISVASAREIVSAFAATGRIDPAAYVGLVKLTKDYAATLGIEIPDAAKELAQALADPARGVDQLNGKLNAFDSKTTEHIRSLARQGQQTAAQKVLMDALGPSLTSASEKVGILARAWGFVTRAASDAADAVGRAASPPTLAERAAAAERARTEGQRSAAASTNAGSGRTGSALLDGPFARDNAAGAAEAARLRAEREINSEEGQRLRDEAEALNELLRRVEQARAAQASNAGATAFSREADALVRSFDPAREELKKVEEAIAKIKAALADPVRFRLEDADEAARTLSGFEQRAGELRAQIAAGGKAAFEALKESGDRLKVAPLNEFERALAEINERYRELIANAEKAGNASAAASYRQARDADVQALRIEAERDAVRSTTLPRGLADRIIGVESGGDPYARNRRSSATGAGQFIDATWLRLFKQEFASEAAGLSDAAILAMRTQAETSRRMVEAYAQENARVLEKAGFAATNRNLYLAHFLGPTGAVRALGADPSARAADVLGGEAARANPTTIGGGRSIGDLLGWADRKMYGASAGASASRERTAEIQREAAALGEGTFAAERYRAVQDLLNRAKQDGSEVGKAFTSAQDLLSASTEKLTPEIRAQVEELLKLADAQAKAATGARQSRLMQDLQFERDQIGRTDTEQQVASRLRGTGLGLDSAEADMIRLNERLRETKEIGSEALKGFVSDLRAGGTAGEALGNVLDNMADRLLDKAIEAAMSGIMGGLGGGGLGAAAGGNPFGFLAGLFGGGGSVPAFNTGGSFTVGGRDGIDRNLISFRASKGEIVNITRPGQAMAAGGPVTVAIANTGTPVRVTDQREERDGRGGRRVELTVADVVAADMRTPGSVTSQALQANGGQRRLRKL